MRAADGTTAQQVAPSNRSGPLRSAGRCRRAAGADGHARQPGARPGDARRGADLQAEYRFRPPDQDALKSIADATGGAVSPTIDVLRKTPQSARAARRALWPGLVIAALALWMANVLRRVRVSSGVTQDADGSPG